MASPAAITIKPNWLQNETENYALLLLALSALLFSGMGCFLKLASETGIPSTELVFIRVTFQGTIIVVMMMFVGESDDSSSDTSRALIWKPFGASRDVVIVVLTRGFFGGIGFILYFYSIKALPIGDAITLFSLYPIITIFLARLILGEQIKPWNLVAAGVSAIGAICIAQPSFLFHSNDASLEPKPNLFGYVTASFGSIFGALVMVLIRKAGKAGAHTLQLFFSWGTFGISFSLLFSLLFNGLEGSWRFPPQDSLWYLLGMCSFGSVAHFLMNYAGKNAPAGLGSIMRSTDIVWAYLVEIIVFHQVPNTLTRIGVTLVVVSLIIVAIQKVKDQRKKNLLPVSREEENTILIRLKDNDKNTYGSNSNSSIFQFS
mmetsp:Transcript_26975/g.62066  ORF Transcript_26975/g.62066 Transcript_26975/m.62066 type:complete len:374 (-) Transcript_26975:323-1444(-)